MVQGSGLTLLPWGAQSSGFSPNREFHREATGQWLDLVGRWLLGWPSLASVLSSGSPNAFSQGEASRSSTALLSGSVEVRIKREAAPSGMSPLSGPGGPERAREPGAVCDGGSPASPGDLPRAKAVSQTLPGETEWGNCSPQSGCQVSSARRHEGQSGSESWPGLWDAIS